MLEKVKRPDGMEVKFHYDALGRRIAKQFGAVITHWVWDGNVPLHEWKTQYWRDWDTEKDCEYYREEKQPLVTWVFEEGTFVPAAKITENQRLSIVGNYMGTPEAMYREDGQAVWTCELNSYGKVRKFQGESKTECPFRYQGQYEDSETGLYYNRFRYYSPNEGMYISQDPIRLNGGINLYSYVHDANGWVDVFGLAEQGRGSDGKFLPKNPGDAIPGSDAVAVVKSRYEKDPNYNVLGEEISFKDTHIDPVTGQKVEQTRRYDLVVEDINTGKIVGVEVKSSETASYGSKQRGFDDRINSGTSDVRPVGAKAEEGNIEKIDEVRVERLCK
jgi:RHS repeat-associated protein